MDAIDAAPFGLENIRAAISKDSHTTAPVQVVFGQSPSPG